MIALAADKLEHEVTLFLAADGVHILNFKCPGEITGEGTGDLHEHLEKLKNTNVTISVQACLLRQGVKMRRFLIVTKQSSQCLIQLVEE